MWHLLQPITFRFTFLGNKISITTHLIFLITHLIPFFFWIFFWIIRCFFFYRYILSFNFWLFKFTFSLILFYFQYGFLCINKFLMSLALIHLFTILLKIHFVHLFNLIIYLSRRPISLIWYFFINQWLLQIL